MAIMAMKWRHHIELPTLQRGPSQLKALSRRRDSRRTGRTYQPPNARLANVTQNILARKLLVVTTCVMSWVAV